MYNVLLTWKIWSHLAPWNYELWNIEIRLNDYGIWTITVRPLDKLPLRHSELSMIDLPKCVHFVYLSVVIDPI